MQIREVSATFKRSENRTCFDANGQVTWTEIKIEALIVKI